MPAPTFADVQLTAAGDLPDFTSLIVGTDALLQRVSFRLQMHLGEFIYAPTRGVPYKQWQSLKPLPPLLVQKKIRAIVSTTPGIDTVRSVNVAAPAEESRTATISMELQIGREVLDVQFGTEALERHGNLSIYVRSRVIL